MLLARHRVSVVLVNPIGKKAVDLVAGRHSSWEMIRADLEWSRVAGSSEGREVRGPRWRLRAEPPVPQREEDFLLFRRRAARNDDADRPSAEG